jgi:hypothetical protein
MRLRSATLTTTFSAGRLSLVGLVTDSLMTLIPEALDPNEEQATRIVTTNTKRSIGLIIVNLQVD